MRICTPSNVLTREHIWHIRIIAYAEVRATQPLMANNILVGGKIRLTTYLLNVLQRELCKKEISGFTLGDWLVK